MTWAEVIQVIGPGIAVYAAIRADIASMKVRLAHLERDLYHRTKGIQ